MKIEKYYDDSYGFPFIAYISDNISDNPSVIFHLHGAGERGDGNNLEQVLINGFPRIMDIPEFKDCVMIMPQCPMNSFWVAKIESLKAFMEKIIEKYSIDIKRIYLTGLSMGGFGTWYMAMAYPDMFAAIAPCCGGGMPWNAATLTMPVWAFHGSNDEVVLPHNSEDMVKSLRKTNSNVKFDLYEGVGHNSWERAYSRALMKWLLSQSK